MLCGWVGEEERDDGGDAFGNKGWIITDYDAIRDNSFVSPTWGQRPHLMKQGSTRLNT